LIVGLRLANRPVTIQTPVLLFLKAVGLPMRGETVGSVDPVTVQELRNAYGENMGFGKGFTFPPDLSWVFSVGPYRGSPEWKPGRDAHDSP